MQQLGGGGTLCLEEAQEALQVSVRAVAGHLPW